MRFIYLFLVLYVFLMLMPRMYYYLLMITILLVLMGLSMKTRTRSLEIIVRFLGGHPYEEWHPKNRLFFLLFAVTGLILELLPIRSPHSLIPISGDVVKYFRLPQPMLIFLESITITAGLKFAGNRLANYLPYFVTRRHKTRSRRHGKRRSRSKSY